MAATYRHCPCCGRTWADASQNQEPGDRPCTMCASRGGYCLHNAQDHPGVFHSSRAAQHNGGEPSSCGPCLQEDVLLAREYWPSKEGGRRA